MNKHLFLNIAASTDATGGEFTYACPEADTKADTQHATDTELPNAWEMNRSNHKEPQHVCLSTTSDCVGQSTALTGTWRAVDASGSYREQTAHTNLDGTTKAGVACRSGTTTVSSHTSKIGHVSPAEHSVESGQLLRQLCVAQNALMHAMIVQDRRSTQVLDCMRAIQSDVSGLQGAVQWLYLNVPLDNQMNMDDSALISTLSPIFLGTLLGESVETTQTSCPE